MKRTYSLRLRLTLIILLPLLGIAFGAGLWQLNNARVTAGDVFDRSLLSAALSISNDVAISGGDALSTSTKAILADTSGGRVFYHVYAPDGVIVAGYATPPVGIPKAGDREAGYIYFNAEYLGRDVRGLRMRSKMQVDGFIGMFTTTVWQDTKVRTAFVRALMLRTFIAISAIIMSLALIVWFGVRIGLRPLLSLQEAIDLRSSDELKPIRRAVPFEVEGIVRTLNRLLAQVSTTMEAQNEFISNAAHQLRTPVAGVLALAEAVQSARDEKTMRERSADLVIAAKETSQLAQRMLAYERTKSTSPKETGNQFSLKDTIEEVVRDVQRRKSVSVQISLESPTDALSFHGDQTMIREAVTNLIDNALRHGGDTLSQISVGCRLQDGAVFVTVQDNGRGLTADEIVIALKRFGQVEEGKGGSGLGLPIVESVAQRHGGKLILTSANPGLKAEIVLPIS